MPRFIARDTHLEVALKKLPDLMRLKGLPLDFAEYLEVTGGCFDVEQNGEESLAKRTFTSANIMDSDPQTLPMDMFMFYQILTYLVTEAQMKASLNGAYAYAVSCDVVYPQDKGLRGLSSANSIIDLLPHTRPDVVRDWKARQAAAWPHEIVEKNLTPKEPGREKEGLIPEIRELGQGDLTFLERHFASYKKYEPKIHHGRHALNPHLLSKLGNQPFPLERGITVTIAGTVYYFRKAYEKQASEDPYAIIKIIR